MIGKSSRSFFYIFVMMTLILVPVLQTIPSNILQPQTANAVGEPLVPVTSVTRSISFPFLTFMGKSDSSLTESITWYQNGSALITDSRGNSFTLGVPAPVGSTFTLLQNSTTVDQKIIGTSLSYDIYWKSIQNSNGVADKFKFSIVGTSINSTKIQFPVTSPENLVVKGNKLFATTASSSDFLSSNQANATLAGGLGIDWSDAVSAGYNVSFDSTNSLLGFSVANTFSIDPTIVATGVPSVSPSSTDYYEGEKRLVNIGGNLFAFYFDGSNLVYRNSTDDGYIWSGSHTVASGTGAITGDSNRWAVGTTTYGGNQYVSVAYWYKSGSTVYINFTRGQVSQNSLISWNTPKTLFSITTSSKHPSAVLAANEANSTNGSLYLTVRWENTSNGYYYHQEFLSSDGGATFSAIDAASTNHSLTRIELVFSRISNGNMLLAQAFYSSPEVWYYVYNATSNSWVISGVTSGAGMGTNTIKEISADSDTSNSPYLAYVTGNPAGALKVVKFFNNNGTFKSFETANSTLTHALPSIVITRDNVVHIYTIASSKVWETVKLGSTWLASANSFGTTFNSPNQLTAAISYAATLWTENSVAPYDLMYGEKSWHASTGILEPLYCDPYGYSSLASCNNATSGFAWQPLNNTKNSYPHVPLFAIANPSSGKGPGSPPNCVQNYVYGINRTKDYINGIGNLTKAGVVVLGYVWSQPLPTGYAPTNLNWVEANVTNWVNCFPKIQGILLDGFPSYTSTGNQTYYQTITSYIHGKGLKYSFGNPGNDLLSSYQGTVDLLNIYEGHTGDTSPYDLQLTNSTLQGNTGIPGNPSYWHTMYDKSTYSFLRYNQSSITQHMVQNASAYVGLEYFTDIGTPAHPNPWNSTATYLTTEASYLNLPSTLLSIQSLNESNNNAQISGFDIQINQSNNQVRTGFTYQTLTTYNATAGWPYKFYAYSYAVHTGNCMVPDHWTFLNTNYTNPATIAPPAQNANMTIYYKATNQPCT